MLQQQHNFQPNFPLFNDGDKMTSREIAELTGKQHAHLMRAIRDMEQAWIEVSQSKFGLASYTDEQGKDRPQYILSKDECLYIATKLNDVARARLIFRWKELESKNPVPQSFSQALMMAAKQQEQIEAQNSIISSQENILQLQAPKALFADAVAASTDTVLIRELAKIICQNGVKIGGIRLFEWMREKGYLIKSGSDYNLPTQRSIELGVFEIVERTGLDPKGESHLQRTTKVTPKGQIYFVNKFLSTHKDTPL